MEIKSEIASEVLGIQVEFDIKGIVEDVQYVKSQYLFIVRKGRNYNSFNDIEKALSLGALVVHENMQEKKGCFISELNRKVQTLMQYFYEGIENSFVIVGVCGTNGKSSVTSYLYELMSEYKCLKIGTHFIESSDFKWCNENTTPSEVTLMHLFHLALVSKIRYVFMEVSSHAIDLQRIRYLKFDYIIYTNIDRDHLDYHKTLIHYRYTKYKLVNNLKEKGIVIANRDELYYQELKQLCAYPIITYGQKASHFQICDINLSHHETSFYVNRFYFHTRLLSKVNVYNLSACIALCRMMKISYHEIYKKILNLTSLEGRLEVIYDQDFSVFIDYAHSSKALYEVLRFLSILDHHRLILVVGCGGEREKQKRSEVGYYAASFCDVCIFTEDNSRYESVYQIMEDMSLRVKDNAYLIGNREKAIEYAVKIAEKNDIILVSGKGNETFLEREGKRIPFNDKEKILKLLE